MTSGILEEIELKLELTSEAAAALEAAGLFSAAPVIVRQHAVYFDTSDHSLAEAGLSLRIRRVGRKRVQTVKRISGAYAGLFTRHEWERKVRSDQPVLDGSTPVEAVLAERIAELVPVFTIENERRLWHVDGIEIVLDRGFVSAGERQTAVCEIELELQDGDLSALHALARQIAAAVPVRLGVLSKAQRGYLLLGGLPGAAKAEPVALTCAMLGIDAFEAIVHACLVQFRLNEPLVLDSHNPEALHQARVALRRLRSACSIYRAMLTDSKSAALADELRWLAGALGEARDLDVLVERATEGLIGGSIGGSLHERLTQAQALAYASAVHALESKRSQKLMLDLAEWLALGDWRRAPATKARDLPARDVAAQALDRYRQKVKQGGRNLAKLDDVARHEVRKAAKKLHYTADFFASLFTGKREQRRHKRFVRGLKALQDQLGALNDLATIPALLVRLDLADHPQAATLSAAGEKRRLLSAAADCHDELIDRKRFWR